MIVSKNPSGNAVLVVAMLAATGTLVGAVRGDTNDDGVSTRQVEAAHGVKLEVREIGKGEPVVLLSGGPGFAGAQMFNTGKHVAATHRAIVPDQRGTGRSIVEPFDPAQFSIKSAVEDLEAIRKAFELERWTLVGHSWGGLLSMAYAAEYPQRVKAMVLISPAGIDSSFWGTYQANLSARMDEKTKKAIENLRPSAQTMEAFAEYSREFNRISAGAMLANKSAVPALRAEMTPERMNPMVGMAMQPALGQYDLRSKLATFREPVVVIQGDEDPIGRETAQRIVDTLPHARLEIIEGCGHWPFLERPKKLNALLTTVLAKPPI